MTIEVLFPEFCNLFGDLSNVEYLKKSLPDAVFIETSMEDEPVFATGPVNLIYLGPMTEHIQERAITKLMPLKNRLLELIDSGTVFLFTGNALEVMGSYIETEEGTQIPALGIFDTYAKRNMMQRHNSNFLGRYEDMEIMGFKSQFTMSYPKTEDNGFILAEKGIGLNKKCAYEGIKYKNFFGTYLIGPILILNPCFTKKLFSLLGLEDVKPAFETEVTEAYNKRLRDFKLKG